MSEGKNKGDGLAKNEQPSAPKSGVVDPKLRQLQDRLDGYSAELVAVELSRQRAEDRYRLQMNMIVQLYLAWGEEDDRRFAEQDRATRKRRQESDTAGIRVLQEYADRENQISRGLADKRQANRKAQRDFESRLRETNQYLGERTSNSNDRFERHLADREARFEKQLQDQEEAFERALAKRNSYPGPG